MKIGFISMSGVRIVTQELKDLGVTLPGFVERGRVIASLPSLAGLTLAACSPHDVTFCYREVEDITAYALETDFDLVAFSTFTAMAYECYALADRYRAVGIPVVIGGLHATLMPEEAKAHADAVCIGEGEPLWPQIVEDAKRGELKPYYKETHPGRYDLRQNPVPYYELLDISRYNRLTVQTSRGCPLDCEFCAASKIFGGYRIKPVAQVMQEIDRIRALWDRPFLELADDNSFVNKRWGKEFLKAMQERDIPWFTETDISLADDPELLDLFAKSGCHQVLIGFESIFTDSLDGIDRANWKQKQRDRYRRAIDLIQSKGISVNGCFIVGLDSDTPDRFEKIRDFILESKLLESQITVLTPFPNTRLYHRLRAEGRLFQEQYWDRCTLFDINYYPKLMSPTELQQGLSYLFRELYNEQIYARRKRHFIEIQKRRMQAMDRRV